MRGVRVEALSPVYAVRRLTADDTDRILALCKSNPQYYRYCGKEASAEQIESDLTALPPGISMDRKYYIGFFDGGRLAAVMDLIDGYPDEDSAFIGFFMLRGDLQGRGVGSRIVSDVFRALQDRGIRNCRLGIDKDNPQSNHFWRKNGFRVIREAETDSGTILVAEKGL